jgi:HlyD family secretion protein
MTGSSGPPHASVPGLWHDDAVRAAPPAALRRLLAAITALLAVLFVLAATVPIGGAVIGAGQIVAQSRVKRVAHPTGGVIAEVLVHNGDHVRAGQVLLRLDNRVTGADASLADQTVEQLLAQRARAEAEQLGLRTIAFPAELIRAAVPGAGSPAAGAAMADQRRLFVLHRTEEQGMKAQVFARIAQDNAAIDGLAAQIAALHEQRRLIERERQGVRDLWDKQLVTISRMNQLDRTAADLDGSLGSLQAQIAQARARIAEAREQAIQLTQSRRVAAGNDLNQIDASLNQQQMRRVTAGDSRDRSDIRAPYAGTVEKIAFVAAGDVIRPAEPIMDIVPDHDAMVVEAMISPADIDHVRTGVAARVRLSSFSRAATPELPGRVIYVATDRSENAEQKQAYYLVRIALDPSAVAQAHIDLKSGMPAEVHIATGSRSLLSYLMKPLRDQFARAFRDN